MGKRRQTQHRKAIQAAENKRGSKQRAGASHASSSSSGALQAGATLPVRGLHNLGNTCFFNSAVQSLVATPSLGACLHEELSYYPGPVTNAWLNTLKQLLANGVASADSSSRRATRSASTYSPGALHAAVLKVAPQLGGFRQQDSHELYISLVSAIHDEAVAKAKALRDEPEMREDAENSEAPSINDLSQAFEGHLLNVIQCKHCEQRSFKMDEIYDISLQIPSANYTRQAPSPKMKHKKKLDSKATTGKGSSTDPLLELINLDVSTLKKRDRTAMKKKQKKALQEYKKRLADEAFRKEKEAELGDVKSVVVDSTANVPEANASDNAGDNSSNGDHEETGGDVDTNSADDNSNADEDKVHDDSEPDENEAEEDNDWQQHEKGHAHHVEIGQSVESWLERLDAPAEQPARSSAQFDGECSLLDCLDAYTSYEELNRAEGNGYLCEKCNRGPESDWIRRDAKKRMSILSPPENLVLHLKRLLPSRKISHTVKYPARLNLAPYCMVARHNHAQCAPEAPAHLHSEGKDRDSAQCWYDLYAVVVHLGSAYGGHYVAYVRKAVESAVDVVTELADAAEQKAEDEEKEEGADDVSFQWYYTSDSLARKASEDEAMSAEAYMLFYCKSPNQSA